MWRMSIEIRDIRNDSLIELAPELAGLHIQTDFTDLKGRLVSGTFQSAKPMGACRIAITLTRFLNGHHVVDSVSVPAGNDPFNRPFRTLLHIPEDSPVLHRIA